MSEPILSFRSVYAWTPFKQFLTILLLGILTLFSANLWSDNPEIHFIISTTSVGFFLWINTFILFFIKERLGRYVGLSILLFVLLNLMLHFTADYLSILSLKKQYVFKMMIIGITIFYFVSMGVTFVGKGITAALGLEEKQTAD